MGYVIHHLTVDTKFADGFIQIPLFAMAFLDGNVGGSVWIDIRAGFRDQLAYGIRAQASRINSAVLANIQQEKEEETELNATMAFEGIGINPDAGINVNGYFHITSMGSKFAATLLQGMDPKGADRSIKLTRRLLNMGWKPKLFSFDMRHGFVYPTLSLSRPWYTKFFKFPEDFQYGRLLLTFFINDFKMAH